MGEKNFKQDADVVQVSLELQAKLGRLKVLSEIGFFEVQVLGTIFKAPTVLTKVPAGEHELKIKYKEVEFNHKVYVEANQTVEYLLTREIVQAERDSHVYELARKEGTEEVLREYIANYKLHQAEAKELLSELKREPKAGDKKSFAIPGTSITLDMRWIPRGRFLMGSPESEKDRYDNELQHWVTLSKGFWMLETQVTQEMWETLMGWNPSRFVGSTLPGKPPRGAFKGARRPVEEVSWDQAKEFIEKLNSKGIGTYRLPTEAEWEYACRAGSTSAYCYGDSKSRLKDYAWYDDNSGGETHEVGGKQSNDWGLYDMHGNVWEWCEDWYGEAYYKESPECDPRGPASGKYHVFRGGSYWSNARDCRSAARSRLPEDILCRHLGFRVLRNYP
ncbi:MAG: hypothetical protein CR997_00845 [Acidobacteria bacterium]|nr:MAG: hypothetical protein CR997_00845 [Acidobacteriota bacterium]